MTFSSKIVAFAAISSLFTMPAMAEPTPEPEVDTKQIDCLAKAIYREAGGESIKGKRAVAHVVMNRAGDNKFPDTPCAVVYQRSSKGCQFSWVCKKEIKYDHTLMATSKKIAKEVYIKKSEDVTKGALFFHNIRIKTPKWAIKRGKKAIIGLHVFY